MELEDPVGVFSYKFWYLLVHNCFKSFHVMDDNPIQSSEEDPGAAHVRENEKYHQTESLEPESENDSDSEASM